jgi:hypothetical protein
MGQAARSWHHRRWNQPTELPYAKADRLEPMSCHSGSGLHADLVISAINRASSLMISVVVASRVQRCSPFRGFGTLSSESSPALPMEHQMDFIAFETCDNLCNDGAKDAFACFRCRRWMVPCALQVRALSPLFVFISFSSVSFPARRWPQCVLVHAAIAGSPIGQTSSCCAE